MTTAFDLNAKIDEFLNLARTLELTLPEEHTLISLPAEEWDRWRSKVLPDNTLAPPLLVRRLDYAIPLLRRMIDTSAAEPVSKDPTNPRG